MSRTAIVKIESYEGRDTFLRCGSGRQDHLYAVVVLDDDGAEIVDNGYRTLAEAAAAWPDAERPGSVQRQ